MKKIYISFIVVVVISLCFYLYYKEGILPVDRNDKSSKIFVIRQGESLNQIIKNLKNENLIRDKIIFYIIIKRLKVDKNIQAGDFRLSASMDAYQIVKNLTHGTLDTWTTIIEGLRKEEISQVISKDFNIPESEFINIAKEGYLFPDTYLIPKDATAGTILKILTSNFERRYNQQLKNKTQLLKLSDDEVIVLASLVEKEARFASDRQKVASIILKRYRHDWPLQIDATVQYALGYQSTEKTWWKKTLSSDDLKINSPYNTYKNTGLPPGPICNPGLAAIEAVINADETTPYWYYLSDRSGIMHYAATIEEHNENIRKYLR